MKHGFTAGAFDVLHGGHVLMLRECKKHCDHLLVGLHIDPSKERANKHKPIQSVLERYIQLRGCEYVDAIIPYETERDLEIMLANFDIDVRFVGVDHKGPDAFMTGEDICKGRNIDIIYIRRDHDYSSTELRRKLAK